MGVLLLDLLLDHLVTLVLMAAPLVLLAVFLQDAAVVQLDPLLVLLVDHKACVKGSLNLVEPRLV